MKASAVVDGVQHYELASWRDFFSLTEDLFARAPGYVYRGQANSAWPVVSSVDRLEKVYPRRKNLCGRSPAFFEGAPVDEEEQLRAFRRAIRGRRGPNPSPLSDDECWVLGQHHGLATPLVDWTRSPFIALFFAFQEERIRDDERFIEPESRAVFALSPWVLGDTPEDSCEEVKVISPLSDDNYRLTSQEGILVRLPRHKDLESYVRGRFSGETRTRVLTKFRIPNDERHSCLIVLNKMGLNRMKLFPDISGAARHVNSLWEPGHEDSIMHF